MPLSKYLLHCHATVSVRLLVGCRRMEQIVPHMNAQQSDPFRSHLNPNQSCFRKYLCRQRLNASNNRRKRACIIFRSLGGEPVELCYEPDIYGIQQIDSVDEETLLLFTSKTDKACLRDLFDSHCFMG